ncbi:MAG: hypothetical protein QXJ27_04830 [Thermoplasmata archaeon]
MRSTLDLVEEIRAIKPVSADHNGRVDLYKPDPNDLDSLHDLYRTKA